MIHRRSSEKLVPCETWKIHTSQYKHISPRTIWKPHWPFFLVSSNFGTNRQLGEFLQHTFSNDECLEELTQRIRRIAGASHRMQSTQPSTTCVLSAATDRLAGTGQRLCWPGPHAEVKLALGTSKLLVTYDWVLWLSKQKEKNSCMDVNYLYQ